MNPKTIRNWVDEGKLRGTRFGKLVRIPVEALETFEGGELSRSANDEPWDAKVAEAKWHLQRLQDFVGELRRPETAAR